MDERMRANREGEREQMWRAVEVERVHAVRPQRHVGGGRQVGSRDGGEASEG